MVAALFQSVTLPSSFTPKMGLAHCDMTRWYPASRSRYLASVLRTSVRSCPTNMMSRVLPPRSLETAGPRYRCTVRTPSPPSPVCSWSGLSPRLVMVISTGFSTLPDSASSTRSSSSLAVAALRLSTCETGCPSACSLGTPVRLTVMRFHCVMQQLVSMPKMGALAPSMRSTSSATSAEHWLRLAMRLLVSCISISVLKSVSTV
mmetsp:Transcript_37175/g.72520  ORF Transcript_37175/g.72520 Transcript_37175/m.72520 type:complete len:204 (-) Transcript_37175:1805-2416(-)